MDEKKNLINYVMHTQYEMIEIADAFPELLEKLSKGDGLASDLRIIKNKRKEKLAVKNLEKVGSNKYGTLLTVLTCDQESIKYAVFSTSPYPTFAETLKEWQKKVS